MVQPQSQIRYTVEEYLEMERNSQERHEYLDGEIYQMASESLAHGDICINLAREISTQLRGTPCRALSKDIKVRSGTLPSPRRMMKGLFSYPDVLVVCGEPQFHDEDTDILTNPTVIIEVLSDSTEAFDRGEKFFRYQRIEPLTEYVLVSQNLSLIEIFARQENNWLYSATSDFAASVHLASIDCRLRLSEVYDRVTFPDEPPATDAPED